MKRPRSTEMEWRQSLARAAARSATAEGLRCSCHQDTSDSNAGTKLPSSGAPRVRLAGWE